MSIFSERVLLLRKEKNLTQTQLADAMGVLVRAYQNYEYGEREPSAFKVAELARFLGVSTDYLLGLDDVKKRY